MQTHFPELLALQRGTTPRAEIVHPLLVPSDIVHGDTYGIITSPERAVAEQCYAIDCWLLRCALDFSCLNKNLNGTAAALNIGPGIAPEGHIIGLELERHTGFEREQIHIATGTLRYFCKDSTNVANKQGCDVFLQGVDASTDAFWNSVTGGITTTHPEHGKKFDLVFLRNPDLIDETYVESVWLPMYQKAIENLDKGGVVVTIINDCVEGDPELYRHLQSRLEATAKRELKPITLPIGSLVNDLPSTVQGALSSGYTAREGLLSCICV